MKGRYLTAALGALLLGVTSLGAAPEKVIVVLDKQGKPNLAPVIAWLERGWTVKEHSSSIAGDNGNIYPPHVLLVFVLSPPANGELPPTTEDQRIAEIRAEYARKRAEWLAKQPKVEKP